MDNLPGLARRLDNLIRLGTIAEVDHAAARCRVKSGRLTTTWLPWLTLRAGTSLTWDPPTIDEQCVLFSPSGETTQALVLVGLYSEKNPAPDQSPGLHRREYPDGARIDYDFERHSLTAILPDQEWGQINFRYSNPAHKENPRARKVNLPPFPSK